MTGMMSRRTALGLLAALPAAGCVRRAPIAEEAFASIGGLQQWISIRGASAANPALLYLHGGPAEAQSPFLSQFAAWEERFTIVNWDQRGSGKTFARNPGPPDDMTLERIVEDAIEVAEHARATLDRDRIILCGQSWGSMVGWRAAKARPDLFHAFAATGLMTGWARSLPIQEAYARAEAERAGDTGALAALDAVADLPADDINRALPSRAFLMSPDDVRYLETVQAPFAAAAQTPGAAQDWVAGGQFSVPRLIPDLLRYDIYADGAALEIPMAVIRGRDDMVTPAILARRFIDGLDAPAKSYVEIPGGHFACFTSAAEFAAALAEHVRPYAA